MGGSLFGGLFGGKSPKVSQAPIRQTQEERRKAKTGRSALFETDGGVTGSELEPDEVKRRSTLLGN